MRTPSAAQVPMRTPTHHPAAFLHADTERKSMRDWVSGGLRLVFVLSASSMEQDYALTMLRCGKCRLAYYCSIYSQKAARSKHKGLCIAFVPKRNIEDVAEFLAALKRAVPPPHAQLEVGAKVELHSLNATEHGGLGSAQDGASRNDGYPAGPAEQHREEGRVGAEAARACDGGRQRPGGNALAHAARGAWPDG
jgi:hypothetical protein